MSTKSIHKAEYAILLRHLRDLRLAAGLTQVGLSTALGRPQSYVSDIERGERRMDLLQLRDFCAACGSSLSKFVSKFEKDIA
ncbi:helix-turn-helix domain-containing protein [Pseudoxanthomonas composti]|uniref:XRE family transcriptional regulator n=1 Tax=Pseudoxanthomonas composti TaxID=2137479 RepID=A0A4Q1JV05_9GAMM|nr:helix-turn-helix transcriptional regulator [Pseudoxanthomonas composti]RXR05970.1 XRE family transcriptional regulator [Pseudoxanthomonas composti]